ncbi:MAG: hypothetical protein Q4G03_05700 [Planctomycetia bacterium]|nr:hypothetical protein [Planctomycetia bacterium]
MPATPVRSQCIALHRLYSSCYLTLCLAAVLLSSGCASQRGKLVDTDTPDRVGSHRAGSEVYDPAAEVAVAELLDQVSRTPIMPEDTGSTVAQIMADRGARRVCFMNVENAGGEEMGDIREDLAETIRTKLAQSAEFDLVDQRLVTAALRDSGLRLDDLLLPEKRARFLSSLGSDESPFDYILFAKVTTATTQDNADSQVKYSLTLDIVNIHTGSSIRQTVGLKKHYNKSLKAKVKGLF